MKHNQNCDICKHNNEFEVPEELYESLKNGSLVVFAGSGISTEAQGVFPYTLYDDVCEDLGIDPQSSPLTFPQLMSKLTMRPNGRRALLSKIRQRIEYAKSFQRLYKRTTRFHDELASIHQVRDIITTNWDCFFEEASAALPVVTSDDFAFWDLPGRKVFKIHGSIGNVGTIIADTDDYARCYENLSRGIIGSALKLILATRTVVFCGYSFSDDDFVRVHQFVTSELNSVMPHAYIVTLDEHIPDRIDTTHLTPIVTDATFFLHQLKLKLVEDGLLIDDAIYGKIHRLSEEVRVLHDEALPKFPYAEYPDVFYTYSYQDGLSDCFTRALRLKTAGTYLCPTYLKGQIDLYRELRKERVTNRRYWDVAYIDGYLIGLACFLVDDALRMEVPMYYIYGCKDDISSFDEYSRVIRSKRIFHKQAHAQACRFLSKNSEAIEGVVPQHTAFLL